MFDCILLLAGKGKRTGLDYNKIKYEVNGKPLYKYSLDTFMSVEECDKIILVVSSDEIDDFKHLENDKVKVVLGGKERQDSVKNGLLASSNKYVLIHDGARCNIDRDDIIKVYENTLKYDACSLAVREKNAIKRVEDGFIKEEINRSDVWCMQTPQGLNRELLLNSLNSIDYLIFDDIQAVYNVYGVKAKIVEGKYENIKVTTPSDLEYIKYLLKDK